MTVATLRTRAYKVFRAAGITIAKGSTSIGRGVYVLGWRMRSEVRSEGNNADDVRAAISALRAAGWTVDDDGTIRGVPDAG